MNSDILLYYEKVARRKVLKRSLLGRLLLGIEGAQRRNRDVLYLVVLPVDALIAVGKVMWKGIRWLLPKHDRAYLFSFLCFFSMVLVAEYWPEIRHEVLWFTPLHGIVGIVFVVSTGKILIGLHQGEW